MGLLCMGKYLLGKTEISFSPSASHIIKGDRKAVTWSLAEPYISRNDSGVDLVSEKLPDLPGHLVGQGCAAIKHGKDNPLDSKRRVEGPPNPINGL
jgi:hypothetical protein